MKTNQTHSIDTGYKFTLTFDRGTLEKVKYFVGAANFNECQWFHNVERRVDHDRGIVDYYIHGMVIPEQVVSGATVESDAQLMLKLALEIREKHGIVRGEEPDPEALKAFNNELATLTVWAHSHVKMACNPSSTDKEMWSDWCEWHDNEHKQPVIMFIFNQKDEYYVRIADPVFGIQALGLPIQIEDPDVDFTYVRDALEDKLKKKTFKSSTGHRSTSHSPSGNRGSSGNGSKATKKTTTSSTGSTAQTGGQKAGIQRTLAESDKFEIIWSRKYAHDILRYAERLIKIDTEVARFRKAEGEKAKLNKLVVKSRNDTVEALAQVLYDNLFTTQADLGFFDGLMSCYSWMDIAYAYDSFVDEDKGEHTTKTNFAELHQWLYEQDTSGWEHPEVALAAIEIVVGWQNCEHLPGMQELIEGQWKTLCEKHIPGVRDYNTDDTSKTATDTTANKDDAQVVNPSGNKPRLQEN